MDVVFVVGCARSGTSILGELIAAHPGVKYIFEAHSIWELGGLGENESHRLTSESATPIVKEKIRQWFQEQAPPGLMLVEKNPRNILRIPYVRAIFPEAKLVHIVRDGRDVACSMIPGCGKKQWAHLKPPSWKMLFKNYTGAFRCAMAWKEIMEIGLQDLQDVPHLQIRYEDLVTTPDAIADQIFTYMGLEPQPAVTEFCKRISDDTKNKYHAQFQNRWYQANHHIRIGRWRENLTKKEQKRITDLLSPLLIRLGYPAD